MRSPAHGLPTLPSGWPGVSAAAVPLGLDRRAVGADCAAAAGVLGPHHPRHRARVMRKPARRPARLRRHSTPLVRRTHPGLAHRPPSSRSRLRCDPAASEAVIRWAAIDAMTSRIARGGPAIRRRRRAVELDQTPQRVSVKCEGHRRYGVGTRCRSRQGGDERGEQVDPTVTSARRYSQQSPNDSAPHDGKVVTGRKHIDRSRQNMTQLARIDLLDNPAGRSLLMEHFRDAVSNSGAIEKPIRTSTGMSKFATLPSWNAAERFGAIAFAASRSPAVKKEVSKCDPP